MAEREKKKVAFPISTCDRTARAMPREEIRLEKQEQFERSSTQNRGRDGQSEKKER